MSGSTEQIGPRDIGDILLRAPIRYPSRFLASAIVPVVLVSIFAEITGGENYFLVSAAILMLVAFINTSIVYVFSSAARRLPVLFIATTGIFLLTGLVWSAGTDGLLPGQFALVLAGGVIASVSYLVMMVLASRAVIRSRPDKQEVLDGVMIFFWVAFSAIGLFLLSREARDRKIV